MTTEEEANLKIQIDANTQTLDSLTQKFEKLTTVIDDAGKKLYILLDESKKLGEVKNPSFISTTPVGSFSAAKNLSPEMESLIRREVLANSRYINASASKERNEGIASVTRADAQKLKAMASQPFAEGYNRNSLNNAALLEDNKAYLQAKAELARTRNEILKQGESSVYNQSFGGSVASALFGQGQRFTYRGGLTGLMARFGSKMATDQNSAFGSVFGKLSDTSSKGNINNWFGGLLSKGTKDGLGINAGGLVLGGFAIAVGAATAGIKKFTDESLDAYGSMQKLKVGLDVVYGSRTESGQSFQGIQNYAIKSPYGITQTTEMAVLLKQSGVYSSELLETLKMVGDVSSGNEEKMKRIANNYAQIQAIGHASMLDMRQFAYAGIPIYKEVADYMKVSQTELRSMISDGKVTSDVIENVFKKMTSSEGMFFGAVEKGAKTYSARLQNLNDIKSIKSANIGEWIYRTGSSEFEGNGIGNSIMNLRESWNKGISNIFGNSNMNRDYDAAKKIDSLNNVVESIAGSTASIDKKTKDNNNGKSSTYQIPESVRNILGLNDNVSNQRAAYYKKAEASLGFNGKNLITSSQNKELNNFIQQTLDSRMSKALSEVDDSFGNGDETRKEIVDWYKNYAENVKDYTVSNGVLNATASDQAMLGVSDGNYELLKVLGEVVESLQNTYTEQVKYNTLLEWRKSSDENKVNYAQAEFETMTQDSLTKAMENMSKSHDNANSISSQTVKYNELYAQTDAGKEEQKKKDEADLKKYQSDYDKYAKMFKTTDSKTGFGTLNFSNFTEASLTDCIKSGILQAEDQISLLPENVRIRAGDSSETVNKKYESMKYLSDNLDSILKGISDRKYNVSTESEKSARNPQDTKVYQDIKSVSDLAKSKWVFSNEGSKKLAQLWSSLLESTMGTSLYDIIGAATIKTSINGKSKYTGADSSGSGKLKTLAPLWKRIFASATGWDADQMNGMNGASAMMGYIPFQNRAISQGMISGMVGSGLSSQQIANKLKYTNNINGISTQQIDWNATAKSFLDMANSADTTSTELSSLYDAVKGQVDVYDKLKTSMFTTGEEWTNIKDMNLSDAQKKQLENAYAGNTYTAEYKSGSKKGTTEEVVMQNGEWVVKSTGELVSSINGLSLKTESILNPLDALSINMKNLEETLNISNSLSQKANDLSKSTSSLQLETAFLRFGLGKFGLQNENNEAISKTLVDTFSPLLDIANKSKDERQKTIDEYKRNNKGKEGYVEISDSVITALESLSGLKEDDLVDALAKLLDTDTFKPLREKYFTEQEKNTKAQKEYENAKFDSGFMSKYGNYMGGNGFFNALSSGAYLKNGNSISDQMMSNMIGLSGRSFSDFAYGNVKDAFKSNNGHVIGGIYDYVSKYFSSNPQLGEQNLNPLKDALNNFDLAATDDALKELGLDTNDVYSGFMKMSISVADAATQIQNLGTNLGDLLKSTAINAWSSSFETFGETLVSGADASETLQDNFQKIGQSLFSQMGTMLSSAGLQLIIGSGGIDGGKIAAGLALMAAGGMSSLLSGMMTDSTDDDEAEKLKQIKEDMADLLKQAREDAVYYENTLRHQTALSVDESVSTRTTSVNDAIIKPNGTIYTNPDDYLYASTDPKNFIGGGSTPNVTFSIVNNGNPVAVESKNQTVTDDGIDIKLVIKNVVAEGLAKGEFNDAMSANSSNSSGWSSVM